MENDFEVFKGKKFSDLCKDVYKNSANKREQIAILIDDLRTFIKGPNDVFAIVPMIKEYLEVGVKNDEQLIKLMAIVKKNSKPSSSESNDIFTEDEKKQLLKEVEDVIKNQDQVTKEIKKAKENKT